MTMFLWDASNYDWSRGPMDLHAAYTDGIRGFTHKATEGTRFVHDNFGAAMIRAKATGIPFLGAYVVPRTPGNNGHGTVAEQLTFFINYVNLHVPWWRTFPGWFWQVDTEIWSNSNGVYDHVSPQVGADMCSRLRQATGKATIHYAPKWAYGDSIPGDEPLWASSYVAGSGSYHGLYPGDGSSRWSAYSGRTPAILQFSSHATVGSQPTCDANAFRGTESDFAELIGASSSSTVEDDMTNEEHRALMDVRWATTQIIYRGQGPLGLQAAMSVLGDDITAIEAKLDRINAAEAAEAGIDYSKLAAALADELERRAPA